MKKVYAVRDVKADAFGDLIAVQTRGLAIRSFEEAVRNPQSPFAAHPEDYMLYELGEYDPSTGTMVSAKLPEMVASASSFVVKADVQQPELPGVAGK